MKSNLIGAFEDGGLKYTVQMLNYILVAGDATVTIAHRYTPKEKLRQHTKIADIIVAAAGLCLCCDDE